MMWNLSPWILLFSPLRGTLPKESGWFALLDLGSSRFETRSPASTSIWFIQLGEMSSHYTKLHIHSECGECSVECCQSHRTMLWIWRTLCKVQICVASSMDGFVIFSSYKLSPQSPCIWQTCFVFLNRIPHWGRSAQFQYWPRFWYLFPLKWTTMYFNMNIIYIIFRSKILSCWFKETICQWSTLSIFGVLCD